MLHGIREGVVALDRAGRIRLLNDEAQRLLGLGDEAIGRPLDEALGRRAVRPTCWPARVTGTDLLTVRGQRVLVANRMPTDDGGAVATLRDRTELEQLGRELDSTRGLIDALRAQDHEHANRHAHAPRPAGTGDVRGRRGVRRRGRRRPPGHRRAGHREDPRPAARRTAGRQGDRRGRAWSRPVDLRPHPAAGPAGRPAAGWSRWSATWWTTRWTPSPAPSTRAWRSNCARRDVPSSSGCATRGPESRRNSVS